MKKASQIRQATRKLHAEQHEIVVDAGRIAINLSIPSGATPEFATSGVRLQWCVRFSFLVSSPPPNIGPAAGSSPMMPGSPHLSQSRNKKEQATFKPSHHSKRSSILGSLVASAEDIEVAAFGRTETIECPIPIKVYPASTRMCFSFVSCMCGLLLILHISIPANTVGLPRVTPVASVHIKEIALYMLAAGKL